MSLKVGIVGLPNVGKSTLFNALLKKQQALAANYPFATIEPNVGVVGVPDSRLERLAEVVARESMKFSGEAPKSIAGGGIERGGVRAVEAMDGEMNLPPIVPASVEFVDIAGIVAGAHKGEGLGNQFLSHVREVELVAHVVRHFGDENVVGSGKDWEEDYETIVSELIFKDLETLERQTKGSKSMKQNQKLKSVLDKLLLGFNKGRRAADIVRDDEVELVAELFLLTMKPEIVVVNVGENELLEAESIKVSVAQKLGIKAQSVVVVSAKIESEISSLGDEDAKLFMADLGIEESGLERLIQVAYRRLGLVSMLTAGVKEVRAWTVGENTAAPQAAGVIHGDFEEKFIKAEVVNWEVFVECGGWKACRDLGKVRLEGRDYLIKDGDVVDFKIGS